MSQQMVSQHPEIESWRNVWRKGFAPILPTDCLKALAEAIEKDDNRLIQGGTTMPPPLMCVHDWPVEAGCALGYCGAVNSGGLGVSTVGNAEEFFAQACFQADQRLGSPAECRYFLNWFDDTPRDEMRRELLPEVLLAIQEREDGGVPSQA